MTAMQIADSNNENLDEEVPNCTLNSTQTKARDIQPSQSGY